MKTRTLSLLAAAVAALSLNASPMELDLTLTGLAKGAAFEIETLDDDHGNAIKAWRARRGARQGRTATSADVRNLAYLDSIGNLQMSAGRGQKGDCDGKGCSGRIYA